MEGNDLIELPGVAAAPVRKKRSKRTQSARRALAQARRQRCRVAERVVKQAAAEEAAWKHDEDLSSDQEDNNNKKRV